MNQNKHGATKRILKTVAKVDLDFLPTKNRNDIIDELMKLTESKGLDFCFAVDLLNCLGQVRVAEYPPPIDIGPLMKTQEKIQKLLQEIISIQDPYFYNTKKTAEVLMPKLKKLAENLKLESSIYNSQRTEPIIQKVEVKVGKNHVRATDVVKKSKGSPTTIVTYAEIGRKPLMQRGSGRPPNPKRDSAICQLVETLQNQAFPSNKSLAVKAACKLLNFCQVLISETGVRKISDEAKVITR